MTRACFSLATERAQASAAERAGSPTSAAAGAGARPASTSSREMEPIRARKVGPMVSQT